MTVTTASAAAPASSSCAPRTPPTRRRLPWAPAPTGPYRLPRSIEGRLLADLAGYRNREAAFALAVFLARFWSSPARIVTAFPIDRRALTEHPALGLTEARVRGALVALEEIGFLDRQILARGSRYRATEHGLHRKPVLWRFGSEYGTAFATANAAAERARGGHSASRRPIAPAKLQTPSAGSVSHPRVGEPKSPKSISSGSVLMGEQPSLLSSVEPKSGLEAALERLWKGCRGAAGGLDDEPR